MRLTVRRNCGNELAVSANRLYERLEGQIDTIIKKLLKHSELVGLQQYMTDSSETPMRSIANEPISEERLRINCQSRSSAQPVTTGQLEGTLPPSNLCDAVPDAKLIRKKSSARTIALLSSSVWKEFRTRVKPCRKRVSLRLSICVDAEMAICAHGPGVHTN